MSLEETGLLILGLAGGTGKWRERREDIAERRDRQDADVNRGSSSGLRRWKQDQGHVPDSHQEKVVRIKYNFTK